MGMTLDKYLKETNTVLITQDAFVEMKNTMRKYQKIEEIVKEWRESGLLQDKFYDLINEVVEDGNDD